MTNKTLAQALVDVIQPHETVSEIEWSLDQFTVASVSWGNAPVETVQVYDTGRIVSFTGSLPDKVKREIRKRAS